MLYTTCCRAAHSSSGVEFSFSSHWARALSICCSRLSLVVLSFAVLSLVGLSVPCLLCFCRILKATFDLSIWCSVQQFAPRMTRVLWMPILSRHIVMMKSIICQGLEPGCIQVVLCSSFCLNMVFVTISSNSEHRVNSIKSAKIRKLATAIFAKPTFYNIYFYNMKVCVIIRQVKASSYITQYPIPRTVQSALHFTSLTDLFTQTPSRLLWEASGHMLQLMREGCSYTYPPLSITGYSFIQMSELEQCRVTKLAQGFNTAARIRTRVLIVESPKLYP